MRYSVAIHYMHIIYNDSAKMTSIFIIAYCTILCVGNTKILPIGTFEIIVLYHH